MPSSQSDKRTPKKPASTSMASKDPKRGQSDQKKLVSTRFFTKQFLLRPVTLVLITLAVAIAIGFGVTWSERQQNKAGDNSNQTAQIDDGPGGVPEPSFMKIGTLTIKELGVSIPLTEEMKGATYILTNPDHASGNQTAYIRLPAYDDKPCTRNAGDNFDTGMFSVSKRPYPSSHLASTEFNVGEQVYIFRPHPADACFAAHPNGPFTATTLEQTSDWVVQQARNGQ